MSGVAARCLAERDKAERFKARAHLLRGRNDGIEGNIGRGVEIEDKPDEVESSKTVKNGHLN